MNEWKIGTAAQAEKKLHSGLKREIGLALGCFLAAAFLWFCQIRVEQYGLAERIAPEILRFHVIANSNSEKDQEVKLKLKSFLIDEIYGEMEAERCSQTKAEMISFLSVNREGLERKAEEFLRELGKDDPVSLEIVWCEFPEKFYGDIMLPAGKYQAAQVKIGKGLGHNWWCVLYPRVCITKDAVAVVPEASQEELKQLLPQEDYLALQSKRPVIHIDFQLRRLLNRWCSYSSASSPSPLTPQ